MTQAVEGIYRNGVVELLEIPEDIQESRVLITFLPATPQTSKIMTLGMFRGDRPSTEADFVSAECRCENQLSIIDRVDTIDYDETVICSLALHTPEINTSIVP
jgi:hypothetical protein